MFERLNYRNQIYFIENIIRTDLIILLEIKRIRPKTELGIRKTKISKIPSMDTYGHLLEVTMG